MDCLKEIAKWIRVIVINVNININDNTEGWPSKSAK
jgi:hypothetical protein